MKIRIKSIIMSVIMLTCITTFAPYAAVSKASAASKPVFSLSVKEEQGRNLTVSINLSSGSFNSIDITVLTSDNISYCSKILKSTEFKDFEANSEKNGDVVACVATASTKKISASFTGAYSTTGGIFEVYLIKASDAPVSASDVRIDITSCSVIASDGTINECETSVVNLLPEVAGKCGSKLYYTFDNSGNELKIYGSGTMNDYASTRLVPWTSVAAKVTKLTITGATYIGKNAYNGFTSLTGVSLPDTVTKLGAYAFTGCTNLKTINLNTVSEIGTGAFKGCTALTGITLSDKLTTIELSTFSGCTSLAKVELGKNITAIGKTSFENCKNLVIRCYFASQAYKFAVDNSIKYELMDKYIIGDVNADGHINSSDALLVLRSSVGEITLTDLQKKTGDVNNDGKINSVDALIILEISVGRKDAMNYQR